MTRITVKELIWDEYNRDHIKKHRVTELEVVEAGKRIVYHKRTYKRRYLVVGRSGSTLVAFVIRRKGSKSYYVVTARDASVEERRKVYDKEKKQSP